jgi:phospholipase/carboxylesterase
MNLLQFHECPAKSSKPKMLVVLLHGYGANGEDFVDIAEYWSQHYVPEAHIICPDGPESYNGDSSVDGGRQWFSLNELSNEHILDGAEKVITVLSDFISKQLIKLGLSAGQVVIAGFSQGAMLSLFYGLYSGNIVQGILGYSGLLVSSKNEHIKYKPPVLLVHGDSDSVVPTAMCYEASDFLKGEGVDVEQIIEHNVGHFITQNGIEAGGKFLQKIILNVR